MESVIAMLKSESAQNQSQQSQSPLSDVIAKLNEQQREIVLVPFQDMMIIAGAGTGKTHVVTTRIAYLLQERHVIF